MSQDITYGQYLGLKELLGAQRPLTGEHDELLFVILHQTMELWMKQTLHEIAAAQHEIRDGNLVPAYKNLARVSRIQAVMTQTWDILSTMTPADYLNFRAALGTSSGFQSAQFRTLEYRLGMRDPSFLKFQPEGSDERRAMEDAFAAPSLYDDVLAQLAKAGFDIPKGAYERPEGTPYVESEAVEAAWLTVYRDVETYWPFYQLAEKLIDLDDALLVWRHKHVVTVERIIGRKRGTGGTDGVSYLQQTLTRRAFPEIWSLRTKL
ncbi:tryptophan 2,3-dioxygenase [Vitreimonas flagellata]|uniref:tryptophan 2,3-dioxygenase n=1 Tax=Vitreimonas flagellata TaxID=2560861 RepID=UPI001074B05F|nr:tryptophan 2,3-dioxygenase [Vitreimonas flagellata]